MTVTEITMRSTPVSSARAPHRSSALHSLAQTAALMSVYDVAGAAAGSVAFLVLPLTGHANQAGVLYLALTGWGFAAGLFVYIARVFQPRLSVWLASDGAASGRRQARALAGWALRLNLGWLVLVGLLIVAEDLGGSQPRASARGDPHRTAAVAGRGLGHDVCERFATRELGSARARDGREGRRRRLRASRDHLSRAHPNLRGGWRRLGAVHR